MNKQFDILNEYFDKIYVITIRRATERQEKVKQLLKGLDYHFFYGVDKMDLNMEQLVKENIYSDTLAKKYNRYSKPMVIGHIACSLSHRKVYEDVVKNNYRRVLIFEDDVVPDFENLHFIPDILNELPDDWEMLYWGYEKNEVTNLSTTIKQLYYHFLHSIGFLKWNHTMISNLYPKKISAHINKAGFHDLLHAYSLTLSGAEKMIKVQTPVAFNADPAVGYAVMNGWLKAYTTTPKIFNQEVQIHPETYHSFIKQ
jgi:glycosyl transferase family 25